MIVGHVVGAEAALPRKLKHLLANSGSRPVWCGWRVRMRVRVRCGLAVGQALKGWGEGWDTDPHLLAEPDDLRYERLVRVEPGQATRRLALATSRQLSGWGGTTDLPRRACTVAVGLLRPTALQHRLVFYPDLEVCKPDEDALPAGVEFDGPPLVLLGVDDPKLAVEVRCVLESADADPCAWLHLISVQSRSGLISV